jgi:hypothetical protein
MARITRKEREELQKLNKNVSNKKSYIRNNKGAEVVGVETLSIKQLESMSRKEVNAYKESMKHFTKRQATNYKVRNEHGVEFTKKEVNEIEKTIQRANRAKKQRKDRVNEMQLKQGGKSIGKLADQRGLMTKQKYADLRLLNFNLNSFQSKGAFNRYKGQKENTYEGDFQTRQDRTYKAHYIRALRNTFGISETRDITRKIMDMSLQDFMDMYYSQLDLADIDYIYDPTEQKNRLSKLKEHFLE